IAPTNLHLQLRVAKQQAMAEELFTMLFGKLASKLRPESKLIVITDGLLNYVPYESLVNNSRYLLEDYEISYLRSASRIEFLRQPSKSASDRDGQLDLLAFGEPVFQQRSKTSLRRRGQSTPSEINRQPLDWD